jgi:hypothetical protein
MCSSRGEEPDEQEKLKNMKMSLRKEIAGYVQKWSVAFLVEEQLCNPNMTEFWWVPTYNAIWQTEAEAVTSEKFASFSAPGQTDLADEFSAGVVTPVKLAGKNAKAELVKVGIQRSFGGKNFRITKFTV